MLHSLELVGTFAFAAIIVVVWSRSAPVEIAAATLATVVRLIALKYRWSAPKPRT